MRLRLRAVARRARERPHIVYITVDDLGWKDIGYHGSTIQTPALDRLAAAGARLEQFYVQPFSSQTRAAAMTGRYPMRYGMQTMQIQWFSRFGVPADERLLPTALKEAGYTTALIGKWQLGHAVKEQWPNQRGFDYFYGQLTGEIDYFKKTGHGGAAGLAAQRQAGARAGLRHHPARSRRGAPDRQARSARRRCFCGLSFSAPQAPLQAPAELIQRYQELSGRSSASTAPWSARSTPPWSRWWARSSSAACSRTR